MGTKEVITTIPTPNAHAFDFSSTGDYLVTSSKKTETPDNFRIYEVDTGNSEGEHAWTHTPKDAVKFVKWSSDGQYMARVESPHANKIDIFNSPVSLQDPTSSISVEKVSCFEFVPRNEATKSKPLYFVVGSCSSGATLTRFYQFPKLEKEKFSVKTQGSQDMKYVIAPNGHAMILWQQSDVDKSGNNYYGSHYLKYVQVYGGNKRMKVAVFDN